MVQRHHDGVGGVQARGHVGERKARDDRRARQARRSWRRSRSPLRRGSRIRAARCPGRPGPSRKSAQHQPGVPPQHVPPQPQPFERARHERLHHDVELRHELLTSSRPSGDFRLSVISRLLRAYTFHHNGSPVRPLPQRVARLRAARPSRCPPRIGEQHAGDPAGDHPRQVEHTEARQRFRTLSFGVGSVAAQAVWSLAIRVGFRVSLRELGRMPVEVRLQTYIHREGADSMSC